MSKIILLALIIALLIFTGCNNKADKQDNVVKMKTIEDRLFDYLYVYNTTTEPCFEKGDYYNFTFDIQKDYNLTCEGVNYLNEHYIEHIEEEESGTIDGDYTSIFSSGYLHGELRQWVYNKYLANQKLIKSISYHLDCNNETYRYIRPYIAGNMIWTRREDTRNEIYYSQEDLVMYYATICLRSK